MHRTQQCLSSQEGKNKILVRRGSFTVFWDPIFPKDVIYQKKGKTMGGPTNPPTVFKPTLCRDHQGESSPHDHMKP